MTLLLPELDLRECGLRIEWANQDGEVLTQLIAAFRAEGPYMTHLSEDGGRWTWRFLRLATEEREAFFLDQMARHIGALLDHFRAALNYLTYQVAMASLREHPGLEDTLRPDAVEFPIFDDPDTYRSNNRVKKLPEEYRAALESVQPYHGKTPALWLLHELAREYRHRFVQPAALVSLTDSNGQFFSGAFPPSARDIVITCDGGPLRQGDEICSFVTDVPFHPDDYPKLVTNIGIDHPLCRGRSCIEVMMDIADTVVQIANSWGGDWHRASEFSHSQAVR